MRCGFSLSFTSEALLAPTVLLTKPQALSLPRLSANIPQSVLEGAVSFNKNHRLDCHGDELGNAGHHQERSYSAAKKRPFIPTTSAYLGFLCPQSPNNQPTVVVWASRILRPTDRQRRACPTSRCPRQSYQVRDTPVILPQQCLPARVSVVWGDRRRCYSRVMPLACPP